MGGSEMGHPRYSKEEIGARGKEIYDKNCSAPGKRKLPRRSPIARSGLPGFAPIDNTALNLFYRISYGDY